VPGADVSVVQSFCARCCCSCITAHSSTTQPHKIPVQTTPQPIDTVAHILVVPPHTTTRTHSLQHGNAYQVGVTDCQDTYTVYPERGVLCLSAVRSKEAGVRSERSVAAAVVFDKSAAASSRHSKWLGSSRMEEEEEHGNHLQTSSSSKQSRITRRA